MDFSLKIVSFECTQFVLKETKREGLEPVVKIKTVADIIDGFNKQENLNILDFIVEEKWILRYVDESEENKIAKMQLNNIWIIKYVFFTLPTSLLVGTIRVFCYLSGK